MEAWCDGGMAGQDGDICRNVMEEAAEALKEAKAREEAEAKVRIMEDQCEELASLTSKQESKFPPRRRLNI